MNATPLAMPKRKRATDRIGRASVLAYTSDRERDARRKASRRAALRPKVAA